MDQDQVREGGDSAHENWHLRCFVSLSLSLIIMPIREESGKEADALTTDESLQRHFHCFSGSSAASRKAASRDSRDEERERERAKTSSSSS